MLFGYHFLLFSSPGPPGGDEFFKNMLVHIPGFIEIYVPSLRFLDILVSKIWQTDGRVDRNVKRISTSCW